MFAIEVSESVRAKCRFLRYRIHIPVEVKSGDVVKSVSLRYYARKHPEAASLMFRLSLRSLTLDDDVLNAPLYNA